MPYVDDCKLAEAYSLVYMPSQKLSAVRLDYASDEGQVCSFAFIVKVASTQIEEFRKGYLT